ncbi:MAG: hypothetical protein HYX68_05235 [Planctomycetes bacterium]|nr:hypothetical protein [Planctomycetota bacterium]
MFRTNWMIAVVLLVACVPQVPAQGRLQSVRDDVRSADVKSTDSSQHARDNDDDSVIGSLLGGILAAQDDNGSSLGGALVVGSVLAPFIVPMSLLGDTYRERLNFTPYPYARGYRGYQILPTELAELYYDDPAVRVRRRNYGVRSSVENGNDFLGLNRFGGQLKVEHASRWGVVANWNWFHERWNCGCTDDTLLGDLNFTFRFAQNEIASMYTGLGMRIMTDRRQTDLGFNFTYGGDWFPVRPLVVSTAFDAGTLGNAGVIHVRGSIGAVWHGIELFGGYDFLRIGHTNLHGPLAGIRFWF